MTDKVYSLNEIQNSLVPILRKYGVSQAWVFGSYARHEEGSDSDVDILLKGFEGKDLFAFGALYSDITAGLGKEVDIVNAEDLHRSINDPLTRRFIRRIKQDRVLIYEKN